MNILKNIEKMKNIIKWFEINFGWFFVNGRKQADWAEYLRKKYSPVEEVTPKALKKSTTKGNVKPKSNVKKSGPNPTAQPQKTRKKSVNQ